MTEPAHEQAAMPMSALLVGGDWACAEGDVGTLARNAELLAGCVAEPLRHELLDLARTCHVDYEHASERWCEVREHVHALLRERP